MNIIEQWLCNKIYKKEIGDYIISELKIHRIAIYGAGQLGEFLYDDLLDYKEIDVAYFIDKNADSLYYGIDDMEILGLEELRSAKQVEAIIITPYTAYESIKSELKDLLDYHPLIISLEDIIYGTE